jgi:hypothetical protein
MRLQMKIRGRCGRDRRPHGRVNVKIGGRKIVENVTTVTSLIRHLNNS